MLSKLKYSWLYENPKAAEFSLMRNSCITHALCFSKCKAMKVALGSILLIDRITNPD